MITLHCSCLASHTVALSDQRNQVNAAAECVIVIRSVSLGQFKEIFERSQPNSFTAENMHWLLLQQPNRACIPLE